MTHEEASLALADCAHGRLPPENARAFEEHLTECDECRTLLRTYREVAAVLREAGRAGMHHPGAEAIVSFAVSPELMSTGKRVLVASHVEACAACASEASETREAERVGAGDLVPSSGIPARGRSSPRALMAAATAAGIALLALGYPVYLGLVRLPRETRRAEDAWSLSRQAVAEAEQRRQEAKEDFERRLQEFERGVMAAGPLEVRYLGQPQRDGLSGQTVTIRPGESAIGLAVTPDLDLIGPQVKRYRVELRRAEEVLAGWELSGAQIREAVQSAQAALVLVVPASALPDGTLEVQLVDAGRPGREPIARFVFQSRRNDPHSPRE